MKKNLLLFLGIGLIIGGIIGFPWPLVFGQIVPSPKEIQKNNTQLNQFVEGAPFVWGDQLYTLVSEVPRGIDYHTTQLAIYRFSDNQRIAQFGLDLSFASAIVKDGVFYALGTWHAGQADSAVFVVQSTDLVNFTYPQLVYQQPGIFNTSVMLNPNNQIFVIAVEVDEVQFTRFTIRFFTSTDIRFNNWVNTGKVFGPNFYAAAPTLRYIDGQYYLWFLADYPQAANHIMFGTKIVKSTDLENWIFSHKNFLVPDQPDELYNASDVDLAEFQNQLYIIYAIGDQNKYAKMKYATFDGTYSDLTSSFFQ